MTRRNALRSGRDTRRHLGPSRALFAAVLLSPAGALAAPASIAASAAPEERSSAQPANPPSNPPHEVGPSAPASGPSPLAPAPSPGVGTDPAPLPALGASTLNPADTGTAATATAEGVASANESEPDLSEPGTPEPKTENPLRPPGEEALLDAHPVAMEKARFRPGKGLEISSEDGRFSLITRLRAQLRYTFEHDGMLEEDDATQGTDTMQQSLQLRRARLQFVGHIFNKHNKFKAEIGISPKDMGLQSGGGMKHSPMLTWYFEFDYLRDATVRMGQYKIPYNRQRVISSGNLMLVDRSLANGEFNLDRDVGFDLRSKDLGGLGKKLRYYAGIYLGEGRDSYRPTDFGMQYLVRVEYLPLGNFKDYHESDMRRIGKPRLSLGGAASFIDNAKNNRGIKGKTPTDGGRTDVFSATGDFMFKYSGLSVQGAMFYRKGIRDFGTDELPVLDADGNEQTDGNGDLVTAVVEEAPRTALGWHGQVGYLIPHLPIEFAGRYAQVRPIGEDASDSSVKRSDEVVGGFSYYIAGHPTKLQFDYTHGWQRSMTDALAKQYDMVRVQLQLAF